MYRSAKAVLGVTRSPELFKAPSLQTPVLRQISFGFPKQYRQSVPRKFCEPFYILRNHWELTPLLFCVFVDILLIYGAIYNSFKNRVDIQLTGHNWNCISRNMDLREPTTHKLLVFNQKYRPWPEMQCVLDKMAEREIKPCALRAKKD